MSHDRRFSVAILINNEWTPIAEAHTRVWADRIAQAMADDGDYFGVQVQVDGVAAKTFHPQEV